MLTSRADDGVRFVCVCVKRKKIRTTTFLSLYVIIIRERRQNILLSNAMIGKSFLHFAKLPSWNKFSSPKHIRENEFVRLSVRSLSLLKKGVCMWKILRKSFFFVFSFLVISSIYFLIFIMIRKLIFQEK